MRELAFDSFFSTSDPKFMTTCAATLLLELIRTELECELVSLQCQIKDGGGPERYQKTEHRLTIFEELMFKIDIMTINAH